MNAITQNPSETNFLNTNSFKLLMKRAPNIQFFVQKINLPSISVDAPTQPTPFVPIPHPGDHIAYDPLNIEFKVSENFSDYLEISNWLRKISTSTPEQYGVISTVGKYTGESIKSDIILYVLTSAKVPNLEIVYRDCFPISLSEITFDSTEDSVTYPIVTASFKYTDYSITRIT